MAIVESAEAPRARHKSFTYRTDLAWTSGRSGLLSAEGKPDLQVSSPPEFKGEPGRWTPEDLFVSAVNVCTMTTFAALKPASRLPVSNRKCLATLLGFVPGFPSSSVNTSSCNSGAFGCMAA